MSKIQTLAVLSSDAVSKRLPSGLHAADSTAPPWRVRSQDAPGASEKRELLVIVERYHAKDRPNFYKIPGGLIDPHERDPAAVGADPE